VYNNIMKKIGLLICLALAIGLVGAWVWVDSHFEEPDAAFVDSLADELDAQSVLAVFAHPDDEQLVTGLLIRSAAAEHAVTRMITFTKGEAGTQRPQISRLSDLGLIRQAELLKNGFALGVSEQLVWDYPDGGVPEENFDAMVARLEAQIAIWQPDLVVTFWPESGFTNHADHMEVGRVATAAIEKMHAEGGNIGPKAIAYILAPRPMMSRFGGERGRTVVANQPTPTHAMPGEGWAKIRGWDIHASQADFVQAVYGMPPGLLHRLYDKEHYYVVTY
jgi:N-acetylglucosamine malate deacetylase 2